MRYLSTFLALCGIGFTPQITKAKELTCGSSEQSSWYGWVNTCEGIKSWKTCVDSGPHCAFCHDTAKCGTFNDLSASCKNLVHVPKDRRCQAAETPEACAAASNSCGWCADKEEKFKDYTRCNVVTRLEQLGCEKIQKIDTVDFKPEYTLDSATPFKMSGNSSMGLDSTTINIRAGQESQMIFDLIEPATLPVDIYITMDMSNSMEPYLNGLKNVIEDLFNLILTKNKEARLGFGEYVDKLEAPMVDTAEHFLNQNPLADTKDWRGKVKTAEPPFMFRNVIGLTNDIGQIKDKLDQVQPSANVDAPEATFDAIMQAAVCQNQVKWRPNSLKLLIVFTDAWMHHAGDGMNIMSGSSLKNSGKCKLDNNNEYRGDQEDEDYVSGAQLNAVLKDKGIVPVFAVTKNVINLYEMVSEQFLPGSSVTEITSKNSLASYKMSAEMTEQMMSDQLTDTILKSISTVKSQQSLIIDSDSESDALCPGFMGFRAEPTTDKDRELQISTCLDNEKKVFDYVKTNKLFAKNSKKALSESQMKQRREDMYEHYVTGYRSAHLPCTNEDFGYKYLSSRENRDYVARGYMTEVGWVSTSDEMIKPPEYDDRLAIKSEYGSQGNFGYYYIDSNVNGLQKEEKVSYVVKFAAKEDACQGVSSGEVSNKYTLKSTSGAVDVTVNLKCEFDCQRDYENMSAAERIIQANTSCRKDTDKNAPDFNGYYICGECFCNKGFEGPNCLEEIKSTKSTSLDICPVIFNGDFNNCNGKGFLNDDNECTCQHTINHLIYGNCCQCDTSTCPRAISIDPKTQMPKMAICNNHGTCMCQKAEIAPNEEQHNGIMFCECKDDWSGEDCSCYNGDDSEISSCYSEEYHKMSPQDKKNYVPCGGPLQGECQCGTCVCKPGWSGVGCNIPIIESMNCKEMSNCMLEQNKLWTMSANDELKHPDESLVEASCPDLKGLQLMADQEDYVDTNSLDPDSDDLLENEKVCHIFEDDCKYYYSFIPDGAGLYTFKREKTGRCTTLAVLLLWIIPFILLCCCCCFLFYIWYIISKKDPANSINIIGCFVDDTPQVVKARAKQFSTMLVRSGALDQPCIIEWEAYKGKRRIRDTKHDVVRENVKNVDRRDEKAMFLKERTQSYVNDDSKIEGTSYFEAGEQFSELVLTLKGTSFDGHIGNLTIDLVSIKLQENENATVKLPWYTKMTRKKHQHKLKREIKISDNYNSMPLTILRDNMPGKIGFTKATYTFREKQGMIHIPIERIGGDTGEINCRVSTIDNSGKSGKHFIEIDNMKVTFVQNNTLQYVPVKILPAGKMKDKMKIQFSLTIQKSQNVISNRTHALINIIPDKAVSSIGFTDSSYNARVDSDKGYAEIGLRRRINTSKQQEIRYWTTAGSGISENEFLGVSERIVFQKGEDSKTLKVYLHSDKRTPYTFNVHLDQPGTSDDVILTRTHALVHVVNDKDLGLVGFSKDNYEFDMDKIHFMDHASDCLVLPITRSEGRSEATTVQYTLESSDPGFTSVANKVNIDSKSAGVNISLDSIIMDCINKLSFKNGKVTIDCTITSSSKTEISNKRATITLLQTVTPDVEYAFPEIESEFFYCDKYAKLRVRRSGDIKQASSIGFKTVDVNDNAATDGTHYIGVREGILAFMPGQEVGFIHVRLLPKHSNKQDYKKFGVSLIPLPLKEGGVNKNSGKDTSIIKITYKLPLSTLNELQEKQGVISINASEVVVNKSQGDVSIPITLKMGRNNKGSVRVHYNFYMGASGLANEKEIVEDPEYKLMYKVDKGNTINLSTNGEFDDFNQNQETKHLNLNIKKFQFKPDQKMARVQLFISHVDHNMNDTYVFEDNKTCIITVMNDSENANLAWNHKVLEAKAYTGQQALTILRTDAMETSDVKFNIEIEADDPEPGSGRFPAVHGKHFKIDEAFLKSYISFDKDSNTMDIPFKVETVDPSDSELKDLADVSTDVLIRSFNVVLKPISNSNIASSKMRVDIVDDTNQTRLFYKPLFDVKAGSKAKPLKVQVVRSALTHRQPVKIPYQVGGTSGVLDFGKDDFKELFFALINRSFFIDTKFKTYQFLKTVIPFLITSSFTLSF